MSLVRYCRLLSISIIYLQYCTKISVYYTCVFDKILYIEYTVIEIRARSEDILYIVVLYIIVERIYFAERGTKVSRKLSLTLYSHNIKRFFSKPNGTKYYITFASKTRIWICLVFYIYSTYILYIHSKLEPAWNQNHIYI